MAEPLLEARGLFKTFGAVHAVEDVGIDVRASEIHALIGPNGAGKTTLIALLNGQIAADAGWIRFAGREVSGLSVAARARLGLARSFQVSSVFPDFTVHDNVALAAQARLRRNAVFWRLAAGEADVEQSAADALARVGLEPLRGRRAGTLAHGEKRALELAMALATAPRLLLLDEPMAGLGAAETRAMAALLQSLRGDCAMLLVEHDMEVVFALADRVSVLDGGRLLASGAPAAIRGDAAVRRAYLGPAPAATATAC